MIGWLHVLCKTSMIPPCHLGIQNLHMQWRYPSGSGIYSQMVRHFPAASPPAAKRSTLRCCLPWRYHRVTWITCSSLWRSLIHRILKSLLPQNNTFFIATVSVVKDAANDPDCQELREQWYYLRFYVRLTKPPTVLKTYHSRMKPCGCCWQRQSGDIFKDVPFDRLLINCIKYVSVRPMFMFFTIYQIKYTHHWSFEL